MSPRDTTHRDQARQLLGELEALLKAQSDATVTAPLVEAIGPLQQAITAFHMEAIRFRMFTLGRRLHERESDLPPEARTIFDAVRATLELAGFHTRSVSN